MMRAATCLTALALCGCTLIVDDEVGDLEINANSLQDIGIRLADFSPHVGQSVDVQLIDPVDNLIQARAVIEEVPSQCVDIRMRRAAPVRANRVDFYADVNMNGTVDPPPDDHAWRCDETVATPCRLERGRLLFVHNTNFQNIAADPAGPIGGDFDIRVTGLEEHEGQSVTAQVLTQVAVDLEGRTETSVPGLVYLGGVTAGEIAVALPGMVDGGRTYDLELTIGDGELVCTLPGLRAPASGDFVIDEPLSGFECEAPPTVDCDGLEERCDEERDAAACETLFRRCAFVDCAG